MISNNEIKKIRSLNQKKFRDNLGLFIVEGEKMVDELKKSNYEIESLYYKDEIGEEAMRKITNLHSPSPVLSVVKKNGNEILSTEDGLKVLSKNGLYLFLDKISDPGNLGTIIRVAEWFGIDAIFASMDTVELYNPKVVQATMGAIFRVNFHNTDVLNLLKAAKAGGACIYGTFLDGNNIYKADLNTGKEKPSIIVIGNEAEGVSKSIENIVSDKLYIPPYPINSPGSESLNAAIATAITLAEFRRR